MSKERRSWAADTPQLLRYAALALAALATGGLIVELAATRHWSTTIRLIPWFACALIVVAIVLVAFQPSRGSVWLARALAGVVLASALFGIYEHIAANYHAGPLDASYYLRWDTMSEVDRWWAAISKSVGPSPPFAPGALAQAALLVLLATIRHPALARRPSPTAETAVPYSAAPGPSA